MKFTSILLLMNLQSTHETQSNRVEFSRLGDVTSWFHTSAKGRCSIDSAGKLIDIVARTEQLAADEHALEYIIHSGLSNLSS